MNLQVTYTLPLSAPSARDHDGGGWELTGAAARPNQGDSGDYN